MRLPIIFVYRLPSVLFVLMGLIIFDTGSDVFCDQVPMVRAADNNRDFTNGRLETLASRNGALAAKREHNNMLHAETRAASLPAGCINDGHTDYPGAINCILNPQKFDCNLVADKAPCTYEGAQRPIDYPVDFVVVHDIEGTAREAISAFHNVRRAVSIHYVVDSDGIVYQILHDKDIAYHAGNYWYNQRALGIENAGEAAKGYQWYNAVQYQASARLTAYLLNKFHIPLDRGHVIGHGDIPSPTLALMPNHVDPGPYWLWDYYFYLINYDGIPYTRSALNRRIMTVHPGTDQLPLGTGGLELPQNYNYFPLYNGPSTASGLIPHAGGDLLIDETSNVEPGISYVYTNAVTDPAGSGNIMYQIWYGVETHLHDQKPSHFASALPSWLAVRPGAATQGVGHAIMLKTTKKIYGQPMAGDDYQIGDAPPGAVFSALFSIYEAGVGNWYAINFNHRQAWISGENIAF